MPHINHRRGETRRSVNREVKCSCTMCGNPRRHGWDNPRTRQELLAAAREDLAENENYHVKRAKKGPKPYTIDKRSIRHTGVADKGWTEMKRYRTEKARDAALQALRNSVRCYAIRFYYPGDEGLYTGPVAEYRAGPTMPS